MYAIVEIAGQQFKVEEGKKIFVHRLAQKEGEKVEFDQVYLVDNDGDIKIGLPTIKGAKVSAKVTKDSVRGDKVKIFKKKRRKGYQKESGHRQNFSEIEIESISL
ncbi:MAG: 50S ribosomal protein L21 [Bacteroidales bacterium]|nr:50S ribosomal protein L21 [Bacteroidales bacterium]MBN2756579.1 50S ribosomal protein L21 [Bacteroidales bacterium]